MRRKTWSTAIMPAITSSPFSIVRGIDSPVRAAVFSEAESDNSVPSSGTRSPAFTSITSPTATSAGCFSTVESSTTTRARVGLKATSARMLSLARSTARSCNASPIQYSSITATASGYSPMAKAPIQAIVMSMNSLNTSPFAAHSHASFITGRPTKANATTYHAKDIHWLSRIVNPIYGAAMPTTSITPDRIIFHQAICSSS